MPFIEDHPDPAIRLSHFAAQENCDGEPYNTMQAGADEILSLRASLMRVMDTASPDSEAWHIARHALYPD